VVQEEIIRQRQEEKMKKLQEIEMKRQQAAILKEQVNCLFLALAIGVFAVTSSSLFNRYRKSGREEALCNRTRTNNFQHRFFRRKNAVGSTCCW
jgi:hypothetical protein